MHRQPFVHNIPPVDINPSTVHIIMPSRTKASLATCHPCSFIDPPQDVPPSAAPLSPCPSTPSASAPPSLTPHSLPPPP
ncbi:hypothetical protein K525DRAFT_255809, partial [Schizophyllum commune Loenen D]